MVYWKKYINIDRGQSRGEGTMKLDVLSVSFRRARCAVVFTLFVILLHSQITAYFSCGSSKYV